MSNLSIEVLVKNCAPTLAGIKTGNIFTYKVQNKKEECNTIFELNKKLSKKGLNVIPLAVKKDSIMVYVFRPLCLEKDFENKKVRELLLQYGYNVNDLYESIFHLMKKIKYYKVFPHEIGLFLSYPIEDVIGFIENQGKNYKYSGLWKVYGDVEKAKKLFNDYKKCTQEMLKQLKEGNDLENLAISK